LDCIRGKFKEKITEVKTHNRWNRERDVKERCGNFIWIVKEKLEETTPKRKKKLGNGGQGIGSQDKQPVCVWWNRESDMVIRIRKATFLKWNYCKTEETFLEY
jgi:hypothetical protein